MKDHQIIFLSYVFGTCSVLGLAVSIWQVTVGTPDRMWFIVLLAIVVITAYVGTYLWIRIVTIHNQNVQEQILRNADLAFHKMFEQAGIWLHKIAHEIRDRTAILDLLKSKDRLSPDELSPEYIQREAESTGERIADYLEVLFSYYLLNRIGDSKVAICIKTIELNEKGQEVARTLCRSKHSAPGRKIGDDYVIGPENTAFFEIRSGSTRYYGKADLMTEYHAKRYSNTNPHWQQQYKSAIVVPIRKGNPLFPRESREEFLLIGFLCADANVIGAFEENRMEAYAQMLMAAADGLYTYFETVKKMGV